MNVKRIVGLAVFILLSFFFISATTRNIKPQYHSHQLNKAVIQDGNIEKTDYLDSDGRITIAADKGYATIVSTNGKGTRLEQYYDEKGEPIRMSSGYYAVFREYDDSGNNIRNTYLDQQMNPVVTLSGYAIVEREYNQDNQVVSKKYFDTEGNPVTLNSFEHGQIYEYGENDLPNKTVYIDICGNPVMTRHGYAIVDYLYYASGGLENGKAESEFYFDEEGKPVSLSLGEYGLHKEYDEYGRESVWTYLDANGDPIITKKGYTTIVRTFHANNSMATEQYLDLEGNPFSLSEGQYGVKTINDNTVYLDENGNEQFNIKNLLYSQPGLIIVAAMIVVIVSAAISRKWNLIFLIGYIFAIAYLTIMFREANGGTLNLEPFLSYRKILTDSEARADILKNIWLFIPLGAILYRIYPNAKVLLISVGLSILIETIQYFAGIGFCELDDVISNGLGGAIGYGMGCHVKKICDLILCERNKRMQVVKD